MEYARASIENLTKETLVDLFSTATYGSDWLEILTLKAEKHLDNGFSDEYLEGRCYEERLADRLLNGGHIICRDWFSAEEKEDKGNPDLYEIDLEGLKRGLRLARDKEAVDDWYDFVLEEDDYCTCNNLMQVVMFGEIIYG